MFTTESNLMFWQIVDVSYNYQEYLTLIEWCRRVIEAYEG